MLVMLPENNSEQASKMASDSAVLTLVGSSFHTWGARTEKSCGFAKQPRFALSDGGTIRPADVVEQSARDGAYGLTSVWRPVPLSWIRCGMQQEASGAHGGRGWHWWIWVDWKQGAL